MKRLGHCGKLNNALSFFIGIPENSCRWGVDWSSRILNGGWGSGKGQLGDEIPQRSHVPSCLLKVCEISESLKTGWGGGRGWHFCGLRRERLKHGHSEVHRPSVRERYIGVPSSTLIWGIKERSCSCLSLQWWNPYPCLKCSSLQMSFYMTLYLQSCRLAAPRSRDEDPFVQILPPSSAVYLTLQFYCFILWLPPPPKLS